MPKNTGRGSRAAHEIQSLRAILSEETRRVNDLMRLDGLTTDRIDASKITSSRFVVGSKHPSSSVHRYYCSTHDLDRLVADVFSPIEDVLIEIDRLLRREVSASNSYRSDPSLIYRGHPWVTFVATGHASYLGWYDEDLEDLDGGPATRRT